MDKGFGGVFSVIFGLLSPCSETEHLYITAIPTRSEMRFSGVLEHCKRGGKHGRGQICANRYRSEFGPVPKIGTVPEIGTRG